MGTPPYYYHTHHLRVSGDFDRRVTVEHRAADYAWRNYTHALRKIANHAGNPRPGDPVVYLEIDWNYGSAGILLRYGSGSDRVVTLEQARETMHLVVEELEGRPGITLARAMADALDEAVAVDNPPKPGSTPATSTSLVTAIAYPEPPPTVSLSRTSDHTSAWMEVDPDLLPPYVRVAVDEAYGNTLTRYAEVVKQVENMAHEMIGLQKRGEYPYDSSMRLLQDAVDKFDRALAAYTALASSATYVAVAMGEGGGA